MSPKGTNKDSEASVVPLFGGPARILDMAHHASWLEGRLQERSQDLSAQVLFRPDGILVFHYTLKNTRIPVFLVVGRTGQKGRITRFGTLLTAVPCPPNVAQRLETHTENVLQAAFPQEAPIWLKKRTSDVSQIGWGTSFLGSFGEGLLVPGETRWGNTVLQSQRFDPEEGLTLTLSGPSPTTLRLRPADAPNSDPWVGKYGPLVLTASTKEWTKNPLVGYIGYALSLAIPPNAGIFLYDEYAVDTPRHEGGTLVDDPFLLGPFRDCEVIHSALFGAKGNVAMLYNLDRECAYGLKWLPGPSLETQMDLWRLHPSREFYGKWRFTDLSDMDLLSSGGEPRLTEMIQQEAATSPDLYFLFNGCAGQLMGDEAGRCFGAAFGGKAADGVSVCFHGLTPEDDYQRMWDILLEYATRNAPTTSVPNRLNLVGYGHEATRGLGELLELLESMGVAETQLLLPTFDMTKLHRFADAAATLVLPDSRVIDSFSRARRHCRGPVLFPSAPFGINGTLRWLDKVRISLNMHPLCAEEKSELCQRLVPDDWNRLRQKAQGQRVAFIATPSYVKRPDSQTRCGIVLPEVLNEMGFLLDLTVLPSSVCDTVGLPDSVLRRWGIDPTSPSPPDGNRLIVGRPGQQVSDLLAQSAASLVYSEWEGDSRVLASGRHPISAADFEMGMQGATRTLAKLVGLDSLPFLHRYKQYFGGAIRNG